MLVFDIETGPRPDDELRSVIPDFDPDVAVPPLGDFDESMVKFGSTKAADKRAAIVDAAREAHYAAIANRPQLIEEARANHWTNFVKDAALDPVKGRVLAVGFKGEGDSLIAHIDNDGKAEEDSLLRIVWKALADADGSLIGHDILRFDIPFLIKRSWLLGVDVPDWVRQGRYFSNRFRDTKVEWFDGSTSPTNFMSLNNLARAFGIQGKHGEVTGANFAEYYWGGDEKRALAFEYLMHDLEMPWQIADKMQLL